MFANKSSTSAFGGGLNFGQSQSQPSQQSQGQQQQPSSQQQTQPQISVGSTTQSTINPPQSLNTTNIDITASLDNSGTDKILKDLLESASNLPKSHIKYNNLGSIRLTLDELERKSQQLRKEAENEGNHTKAHYLLAGAGVATGDIEDELNKIQLPKSTSFYQPVNAETVESHLKKRKEESILNTIEQSFAVASNDFDNYINANISIDWKARREELRKVMGIKDSAKFKEEASKLSVVWKSSSAAANIFTPLKNTNSSLKQISREKFENYANVVYALNESRLVDEPFSLCLNFYELNKVQDDSKSKQVAETWKILQNLTSEKFAKTSQEKKFAHYSESDLHNEISLTSKRFLEGQFLNYIEHIYVKHDKPQNFLPGTNINKVSFFIHQVILKNEPELANKTLLVNGTPIWALIYYLMRSGLYSDASDIVNQNGELFNKFDRNFPVYIKAFVDQNKLPSNLSERIHQEFGQQFQYVLNDIDTSVNFDPYKYSVYKIIGKCDLSNPSLPQAVNLSVEDWLWFHLSIINESESSIYENYSLANLQGKVLSLGAKYFTSSNNPLYLKTLILTGLYELAVQYCYDFVNEADSVHLAIGLAYYGVLHCYNSNKNEVIAVTNNKYEVNFGRITGAYTTTFKISDPKVACEYLIMIALVDEQLSHDALRELLLVTREFGALIGELYPETGFIEPGVLETQRKLIGLDDINAFHHEIVRATAIKCEDEGRVFDALLLYQLARDYEATVVLMNNKLADIIATSELDKPISSVGTIDDNLVLLSEHIWRNVTKNSYISKVSPQTKQTCDLLISVIKIRDLFVKRQWREVIASVNKLDLIPADAHDDLLKVRSYSDLITNNKLDENLIKVLPSLLVLVMTCISNLNYGILARKYQPLSNEREELNHWKKIARNCVVYAGMVQYKMPREVYSLLISLESSL
ncbi:NIC96 [Candida margitis]|uniref:NIC96 n=1 Tax=Candida margitis TaxID=1775924 RepID=UPI002227408E|nr:NIC96 [Candida margitis]KAI5953823.1 NIC96 [Candida margitis]